MVPLGYKDHLYLCSVSAIKSVLKLPMHIFGLQYETNISEIKAGAKLTVDLVSVPRIYGPVRSVSTNLQTNDFKPLVLGPLLPFH